MYSRTQEDQASSLQAGLRGPGLMEDRVRKALQKEKRREDTHPYAVLRLPGTCHLFSSY